MPTDPQVSLTPMMLGAAAATDDLKRGMVENEREEVSAGREKGEEDQRTFGDQVAREVETSGSSGEVVDDDL